MNNIHEKVTETIIKRIESGVMPWHKPWNNGGFDSWQRPLRANGKAYKGINTVILWAAAIEKGYSNPNWLTFKQADQAGGHVRKGEKSIQVVFWKEVEVEDRETGEDKKIPFMQCYNVFNAEQCSGLPEKYLASGQIAAYSNPDERNEAADNFVLSSGARVEHGGNRACYNSGNDRISMPEFKVFESAETYYGTILHELTHWTGHKSRCDRQLGNRFGSQSYAAEELIAELGASFLCADLALEPVVRDDHAAYIENWLTVLKNDSKAIFTAAAAAEKATTYLHGLQNVERTAAA